MSVFLSNCFADMAYFAYSATLVPLFFYVNSVHALYLEYKKLLFNSFTTFIMILMFDSDIHHQQFTGCYTLHSRPEKNHSLLPVPSLIHFYGEELMNIEYDWVA